MFPPLEASYRRILSGFFRLLRYSDRRQDGVTKSVSGSRRRGGGSGSTDEMRKVMRREKNRIAAQKSRMRQTQKADSLHLESESLEKENAALRKEVKRLTEEAKYLTTVLTNHEAVCTGISHAPTDLLYGTPFHQHINVNVQHYPL
ncbi:basic leucine zipper transcriptional factor ATF-like isoform X1 [Astyanax mexicanus]|uniref:basic leucine zipper transcriptional factor ATF-like isoform X1 n=2 Tax=Astyanax mexicanus TaxID=7994 RepID=UPI0020CB1F33|nr:basic leucine zipper transcriptional factor ATF-like isoform X1 [Astyanax mexicanus]